MILDIQPEILGMKEFDKYISFVKKLSMMKIDKGFQDFIKNKVMETAYNVTDNRLDTNNTNNDAIQKYKDNHKIREFDSGFILYNDTKIQAIVKGVQNSIENYPNGEFNIALAFEYGVGIIGSNSAIPKSWDYNIQDYYFGWYLPQEVTGRSGVQTGGYQGYEIYRYIAIEVQNNLKNWVEEYYRNEV